MKIRFRNKSEFDNYKLPYTEIAIETKKFISWFYWSPRLLKNKTLRNPTFNHGAYGFDFRFFIISGQFRIKKFEHNCL